jgi:adenine phosphoribosyltransferase
MSNEKIFPVTIASCKRELPICPINDKISIAAFIMFGDVEITKKSAAALLKKCPDFDILVTAESKGIPLCYEMARQSEKKYIVARKSEKLYMKSPVCIEVKSITTANVQKLYLSKNELEDINNKKVLIVDDVISTGRSLLALEEFINKANGKIVAKACVLAEGDASKRDDIIFLNTLPIFEK